MVFIACRYNPSTNKFEQAVDSPRYGEPPIRYYDTFDEFYNALGGDLHDCDLVAYDFSNVDATKYNLDGSMLSSSVLMSLGRYDSSFFDRNIKTLVKTVEPENPIKITEYASALSDPTRYMPDSFRFSIFYVTDVHLDQKLASRFPESCSESDVRHYCNEIIENFAQDVCDYECVDPYVLIGGDVSSNIEICRIFYEQLTSLLEPKRIIFILGNHELWATHNNGKTPYDVVIKEYQSLADSLHLTFLEDQLLMVHDGRQVYDLDDLMNASDDDIIDEFSNSELLILGGVGFSPFNPKYNASSGQYMSNIDSNQEQLLASRFDTLHSRLKEVLWFKPLIVLTHMPKHDWSHSDYCPMWSYVSGHNHQNHLEIDDNHALYSDNQIGYPEAPVHLKMFDFSRSFDIFHNRPNGIYEITADEYRRFYHEIGLNMTFNRNAPITMLKNAGFYMFLLKSSNGNYSILNGGSPKRLPINDVDYYFDNMVKFSTTIQHALNKFSKALHKISVAVRSFGGSGKIHGCIVDVDFLNHIYLNPFDGSAVPYHATSIVDKQVYGSIRSLISNHCPELMPSLELALARSDSPLSALLPISSDDGKPINYYATDIYYYSKVVRGYQYLMDYRVIRRWDDSIVFDESVALSTLIELSK